jgi:hypothetical protein
LKPSEKCHIKITKFKVFSKLVTKTITIAETSKYIGRKKETIPGQTIEPKPLQTLTKLSENDYRAPIKKQTRGPCA